MVRSQSLCVAYVGGPFNPLSPAGKTCRALLYCEFCHKYDPPHGMQSSHLAEGNAARQRYGIRQLFHFSQKQKND